MVIILWSIFVLSYDLLLAYLMVHFWPILWFILGVCYDLLLVCLLVLACLMSIFGYGSVGLSYILFTSWMPVVRMAVVVMSMATKQFGVGPRRSRVDLWSTWG